MWALQHPRRTITSEETLYTDMPAPSFGGSFLGWRAVQTALDEFTAGAGEVGWTDRGPRGKQCLQPPGPAEGTARHVVFVTRGFLTHVGWANDELQRDHAS